MLLVPILLSHCLLLIFTRFTLWPEMVVYPYLMNRDFALYRDIINPYPPYFLYFLSVFSNIFGYSPYPFQILTWALILTSDVLIYYFAKEIFSSKKAGILGSAFFAILSIPFGINGLWFEIVQTPLILTAVYFFLKSQKPNIMSPRFLFISSSFLWLAFFIKQQTIWIILFFTFFLAVKDLKKHYNFLKHTLFLFLPSLIFLVPIILYSLNAKVFKDLVFWVFYFPFFKSSTVPGYFLAPSLKQLILVFSLILIFLPLFKTKDHKDLLILVIALILGLFAYPRFDYFHLIPLLSLLSLIVFQNSKAFFQSGKIVMTISLVSLIIVLALSFRFIGNNFNNEVRFFEKDIYKEAAILESLLNEKQLVYMQNSPDQLLPLSGTIPPKPWADEFPWYLENTDIQDKITESLKKNEVDFVLYKPYLEGSEYELGSYRPQKIVDYIETNYVNLEEISSDLWLKSLKQK